jgi:hypothetical protein
LNEYDVSDVLNYTAIVKDQAGNDLTINKYIMIEKMPNTLTLVEVGEDIKNKLLIDKKAEVLTNYKNDLYKRYNVTFY